MRAICQYFICQKLHNVMSLLLQNHSLCTRPAAICTSLIVGMESPLKAAYEDIASPKSFVHQKRRVDLSVNARKAIQSQLETMCASSSWGRHSRPFPLAHGSDKFPARSISHFPMNIIMAKTCSTAKVNFSNPPEYLLAKVFPSFMCIYT